MKILYVAPYRDGTGYGQAAIDYILALDAAGVDVVCRPLKLNTRDHQPPLRVQQLERKSAQGASVCIQHCLPHQMDYNGHFEKNIGLFAWETSHFRSSAWAERLNLMDEVWVINDSQAQACRDSGVTRPIAVVPHATDIRRFQRSYAPLAPLLSARKEGLYLFYWIGEAVRRKNLAGVLRAFHMEFDPSEPVALVVKTDMPGVAPEAMETQVGSFCEEVKRGLKIHPRVDIYRPEIILTGRYSEESLLALHASCDCFVTASYGEAWCIPAFDGMAMGRTPIAPDWGGFRAYLDETTGWPIPTRLEPVFGVQDSFADLYTGREAWASPDLFALARAMRQAYADRQLKEEKAAKGIERAYSFTHEAIGLRMKELLYEQQAGAGNHLAGAARP